jgi:spermidine/putrescine-binding protein
MNNKEIYVKKFLMVFCIVGLALLVGSCGKATEKLNFYNWVTYIPDEVIRTFEKETGI